jgi:hypothetical protein
MTQSQNLTGGNDEPFCDVFKINLEIAQMDALSILQSTMD